MADIVLIYPKGSFLEKVMKHHYMPLPLLNISVYVSKEYSVKIIDQRTNKHWKKALQNELKTSPKCVGVTASTGEQILYALEASRVVKEVSDVPVIWGGPHPSILPKQTLNNAFVDYVLEGEGEVAFYEFVKFLDRKKNIEEVHNLWYVNENGQIKNNSTAPLIDLDNLPFLPYHLINEEDYILSYGNKKMLILEGSRGCPHRCGFCYVNKCAYQQVWRGMSPEIMVKWVEYLKKKFKVDGVIFQDLNSFVSIKRMKRFAQLLLDKDLNVIWNVDARVDDFLKLDDVDIRLLNRSGLRRVVLGVEAGSQKMLDYINKGINVNDVYDLSRRFVGTGIHPYFAFIMGFPDETEKDRDAVRNMITNLLEQNSNAKVSLLHCYRPLPGNPLFEVCKEKGLKEPQSLEEWGLFHTNRIDFPWLSQKTQKEILKLNFLSMFLDKKYEEIDNKFMRFLAMLYKPIARFRFKHDLLGFLLALKLKELVVSD